MKSYLEVTWLMNAAVIFACWSITSAFYDRWVRISVQCCCALLCSFACWCMKDVWYGSMLVRLGFGFFLYRRQLVAPFQSVLIQTAWMTLCAFRDDFAMKQGILYCSSFSHGWMAVILICLVSDVLIRKWIPHFSSRCELYVPVIIETPYEQVKCVGYLDTGNCAVSDGLPVVFVRQKLQCNTQVEIESVTGTSVFDAVLATVIMDRKTVQVIVASAPLLQIECLLHKWMI